MLCGEGASKNQPQCKKWCEEKAQEVADEVIKDDIDVAEEFNEDSYDLSPSYALLTGQIKKIVGKELDELEIMDENGNLTQERKNDGFREMCKIDQKQDCEAKLKSAISEAVEICGDLQSEAPQMLSRARKMRGGRAGPCLRWPWQNECGT